MEIHWKSVTESTNLDARSGVHGDVFAADYQTAGRGRLDHRWESARGLNLMFSAVFGVSGVAPQEVATFPLVAGLAIAEAVEGLCPELAGRVAVKWPNDVLVDGRKLAGILCERNGDCVIAGVGLNVNQRDFPEEITARATSLSLLCGRDFDRTGVLDALVKALYEAHTVWKRCGFAAFRDAFSVKDALRGRSVSIRQTDSDAEPISGLCEGVQGDGSLLVGGERIYAGEAHIVGFSPPRGARGMV